MRSWHFPKNCFENGTDGSREEVSERCRVTGQMSEGLSTPPANKRRSGACAVSHSSVHSSRGEQTFTHTHKRAPAEGAACRSDNTT